MSSFFNSEERVRGVIEIEKLSPLISNHPAFRVDPDVEGYKNYAFGGRAGPCISIANVAHEVAHAVEFGPENFHERCGKSGMYFFRNISINNFSTTPASDREARTFAIQYRILTEFCGQNLDLIAAKKEYLNICSYVHDVCNFVHESERNKRFEDEFEAAYARFDKQLISSRLHEWLELTAKNLID